ncbi:glycosyltransferase family 69 protein [Dactylonectria estremocensis]|uniref:Glycosyltransferase family 69 protein n=1 Tax=Dactylonectria estremocensis TaxID=1079267 RepID=A0A9P9F6X2_9HYPO|nr:glycosyltransferase family 69 protein [Dactylonectria estremocensis]
MRRKLWLLAVPVTLSLFLALSLYFDSDQLRRILLPFFAVRAHNLSRLECPYLNSTRYGNLKAIDEGSSIEYFFALDLRQCLALLPTLLGSILEAMRFLGPERCALSIVEGFSPDGTYDILTAIKQNLEEVGASYHFQASRIDTSKGDRIQKLADLRNMALKPLIDQPDRVTETTTILFLNDVAIFARGINGDSFFEIPPDGNWDSAWKLFGHAEETRGRFSRTLPFQAFSCWNGAVTFAARLLTKEGLRFRRADRGRDKCEQGEPQLCCKDMWFHGLGKIAVIPTVNLGYSVEKGKMIKEAKGFVSDHVAKQHHADDMFEWAVQPPARVKRMPTWDHQFRKAWNQSLLRRKK